MVKGEKETVAADKGEKVGAENKTKSGGARCHTTPSLPLGLSTFPKGGYRSSLSMFLRNSYVSRATEVNIGYVVYSSHGVESPPV